MSRIESKKPTGQEELGFKDDWHKTFEDYSDPEKEVIRAAISQAVANGQQLSPSQRKFERLEIEHKEAKKYNLIINSKK